MAGVAVAESARVGRGQAVRRGRGIIRVGEYRRAAGQRARHPPSQAGAVAVETARLAPEISGARSTAAADRCVQKGGGTSLRLCPPSPAPGGRSCHAPDLHLPTRQGQAAQGRISRRALSAAVEPGGRGCRRAVGTLPPTHPDRSGVQNTQERVGSTPDLSPVRKPRGGPHPGGLPRLRSFRNAQTKVASPGPGTHPASGIGKAGDDPDAGCLPAHHRRPLADHATLHPAGTRSSPDAAPTPSVLAFTTAPPPQDPGRVGTNRATPTEIVVPTFENPAFKKSHLSLFYPLNCESSAITGGTTTEIGRVVAREPNRGVYD